MGTQNLRSRETAMGNRKHASSFAISLFWDGLQGSDRDDKRVPNMAKICNWIGGDKDAANLFLGLQDISYL